MIAYVVNRYPCWSESFIQQDMRLLAQSAELDIRFLALEAEPGTPMPPRPDVHFLKRDARVARKPSPGRSARLSGAFAGTRAAMLLSRLRRRRQCGELAQLVRAADIAHIHAEFADVAAFVARQVACETGRTYSVGIHARDVFCCKYPLNRLLGRASGVMACNATAAHQLTAQCPALSEKTRIIHHGLVLDDWPFRAPGVSAGKHLAALFVGRLVEKKGVDILLHGLAAVRAKGVDVRLVVVGSGPEEGALQALAADLGLSSVVAWRGRVDRERVRDEMAKAHCLVVPGRIAKDGDRDGVPNVVVEAMATGLPVIGTRVGGIGEVLSESTGWPFDAESAEALTKALAEFAGSPEAAAARADAARGLVEREFDADACIRMRVAMFGDMLARGREQ